MGRTACTEPQCLFKGDLYLFYLCKQQGNTNFVYLVTSYLLFYLFIHLFGNLIEKNNRNKPQSVNSNCFASQIKDTVGEGGGNGGQELDKENSVGKKCSCSTALRKVVWKMGNVLLMVKIFVLCHAG